MRENEKDFEYWEAKHAYQLERIHSAHHIEGDGWLEFMRTYNQGLYDWLFVKLGNKCSWCGRNSQEIKLHIDHVIPKFRHLNGKPNGDAISTMVKEFDNGDELRLLCQYCHRLRHAF